jgi:hypothetical protein
MAWTAEARAAAKEVLRKVGNRSSIVDRCPCCGQEWAPGRSKEDARRVLKELAWSGPVQIRVFERLLLSFGSWVTRGDLIDAAFVDDPNGGPDNANNFMAVTVNRMRRRVRLFGFEIDGKAWYGSRLRWATPQLSDAQRPEGTA